MQARVTIDKRGRLVLPKKIREAAGIEAGTPLDVRLGRDGRIEIEPAPLEVRLVRKGPLMVAVPLQPVPPLTAEEVRRVLEALRNREM